MNKTLPLGRAARLYQFGVSPQIGNGLRIDAAMPPVAGTHGRRPLPRACQALPAAVFKICAPGIARARQAPGFFNCLPLPHMIGMPIEFRGKRYGVMHMASRIWRECTFPLFAGLPECRIECLQ
ncbi:hypothetical protein [Delftia sp. RIT313]|uniref:hypothetical protein n=1 Tax=Delftia sp. RIT313 TaxID=1468410 RepID=UPI000B1B34BF|nr:hypothetical protein [Delftia sp. RIT313]